MPKLTFSLLCGFSSLMMVSFVQAEHHHDTADYSAQFAHAKPATQLQVEQCWLRLLPKPLPSAGYFVIHNQSDEAIRLIAVATPSFDKVMLHETVEENGMTKMQMADNLPVAAQESLSFKPGGLHLMFEQPNSELKVGDTMPLELLFNHQKKLQVECEVKAAKARSFD